MKKGIFVLGFAVLFAFAVHAQEKINIDTDFVAESSSASYEEWTGGYAPSEINTGAEIMDIGRRLGKGIKYQESVQGDPNPYNKGNPAYKYSAARIYGLEKRGADVLLIGHTATVDTIKCLKLIIRGYLESAFGYSAADSKVLAEKICYWNTSNYDNLSYFDSVFEASVKTVFEGRFEHVGLSSSYKDWKGSILVIPHIFSDVVSQIEEKTVVVPEVDLEEMVEQKVEESEVLESPDEVQPEEASVPVYEPAPVVEEKVYEAPKEVVKVKHNANQSVFNTKLIILICAVVAAILILVFVFVVLNKKS